MPPSNEDRSREAWLLRPSHGPIVAQEPTKAAKCKEVPLGAQCGSAGGDMHGCLVPPASQRHQEASPYRASPQTVEVSEKRGRRKPGQRVIARDLGSTLAVVTLRKPCVVLASLLVVVIHGAFASTQLSLTHGHSGFPGCHSWGRSLVGWYCSLSTWWASPWRSSSERFVSRSVSPSATLVGLYSALA